MAGAAIPDLIDDELDAYAATFEAARERDAAADLAAFLPPDSHPLHRVVLCELVRIDLELGWSQGRPVALDDYRQRFPTLFADANDRRAVAFEEYRLRRQAGDNPDPGEYAQRYSVDTRGWPADRLSVEHGTMRTQILPAAAVGSDGDVSITPPPGQEPTRLPEIGAEFLGFRVAAELGRGAFGRVYLAHQGDLSDRPVVLKVARDARGESRVLARLQHTNIVPIHSAHHAGRFHAICMPFLGATTLADLLRVLQTTGPLPASGRALIDTFHACRAGTKAGSSAPVSGSQKGEPALQSAGESWTAAATPAKASGPLPALRDLEGRTYVEVVLWMGARLASGLAHAHDRGILHCDLKPANVLLADDGQPMLLDFNLSKDMALPADAPESRVGGTLPYMAPEHLRAFHERTGGVDARSDVYGLGVLLYELLTGRLPFTVKPGPVREIVPIAIAVRFAPPPSLRASNPAVSPAAEAIVLKCLEPDPANRYASAHALQEDLDRHLQNLALRHAREPSVRERARKWARRHPRLSSGTAVGLLAAMVVLALGGFAAAFYDRMAQADASANYDRFHEELREAQIAFLDLPTGRAKPDEVSVVCRRPLDRYRIGHDPAWSEDSAVRRLPPTTRERLVSEVNDLEILLAKITSPRAETAKDEQLNIGEVKGEKNVEGTGLNARNGCRIACELMLQGRFLRALPYWERASLQEPQNVWAWYGLGTCNELLGRPGPAAAAFTACLALNPDNATWSFKRGLARLRLNEYAGAIVDFDRVLDQKSGDVDAHINRGLARLGAAQAAEAVSDFTRAIELRDGNPRVLLMRAEARKRSGDREGANKDRAEAANREPIDEDGWIARGTALIEKAPAAALSDFDRALQENPRSLPALENKAVVLALKMNRTADAVAVLDDAVRFFPEHGPSRIARGLFLARLGHREAALRDAREAVVLEDSAPVLYRAAAVHARAAGSEPAGRERAVRLLADALRLGYGHDKLPSDSDFDPVRNDAAFRSLAEAARVLQSMP